MAAAVAFGSALSGGLVLAGQGRFAAWGFALGLPRSPIGAIAFLIVVLLVTYALLTVFIKISVPSRPEEDVDVDEEEGYPLRNKVPAEPTDEMPDPEWKERAGPNIYDEPSTTYAPEPEPEREPQPVLPLEVEAIRVHGVSLAIGDTASHVMSAFRPGEGDTSPLVERNDAGQAASVTRTYRVGRRRITLTFERPEPDTPLRLTRITVGE